MSKYIYYVLLYFICVRLCVRMYTQTRTSGTPDTQSAGGGRGEMNRRWRCGCVSERDRADAGVIGTHIYIYIYVWTNDTYNTTITYYIVYTRTWASLRSQWTANTDISKRIYAYKRVHNIIRVVVAESRVFAVTLQWRRYRCRLTDTWMGWTCVCEFV